MQVPQPICKFLVFLTIQTIKSIAKKVKHHNPFALLILPKSLEEIHIISTIIPSVIQTTAAVLKNMFHNPDGIRYIVTNSLECCNSSNKGCEYQVEGFVLSPKLQLVIIV